MDCHLLRVACPDQKGLIYKITEALYTLGLNIDDQEEFVEKESSYFFLRTEFSGELRPEELLTRLRASLGAQALIELRSGELPRVVVLASKEAHCLGDLLIRHEFGELDCKIVGVISNHPLLAELVSKFNIPFRFISHEGKEREQHELELLSKLNELGSPDYLVLAKYMRVLSDSFVNFYPDRIINIHHSFLPAFIGANPYRQAYQRGVKIIGATAHFVTAELDRGPIISQDVIPVSHTYTSARMKLAGRDVEKTVLAKALKLVLEGRVFVHHNRTIIFG